MTSIYERCKVSARNFIARLRKREAVRWGYRLFLDREPESATVVAEKGNIFSDTASLRKHFMESPEFEQKNACFRTLSLSGHEPPMLLESVTSEKDLQILFQHIQDAWNHLGETEPYWSVLASEDFRVANIQNARKAFYESGKMDVVRLLETLKRNEIDHTVFNSCLEYGCGLGRVTYWLAKQFGHVYGYDISRSHLQYAGDYLSETCTQNVTLQPVTEIRMLADFPKVDLIYSVIVLQHNPPPVIEFVLRAWFQALNPGGVAYFQVPTYRLNYHFSLSDYLNDEGERLDMEMHVLPQRRIFEILAQEGGRVIEVIEDNCTGLRSGELSNTILVQKL